MRTKTRDFKNVYLKKNQNKKKMLFLLTNYTFSFSFYCLSLFTVCLLTNTTLQLIFKMIK